MLFANIDIIDENLQYRTAQWVGVKDGRIGYIGDSAPEGNAAERFGETYDGDSKLLMSGFYNAHAHAPMTLLRGYAESLPLQNWLNDKVFPFEAKITDEDAYWATLLACAEMARYGVVSFSDMYYFSDARIKAVIESGLKMNACHGLLAFEDKPYSEYETSAISERLIREYQHAEHGRIVIDYNIHAEYTSVPQVVADIAKIAKEKGARIHLHASETRLEHEECKTRHGGLTPIQYFDSLGVFENPTTAAHCVWVDEKDREVLKDRGVFVACNPASNMKLGSGFAPIPEMLDQGISVALGTDGVASNNNHDMMQDMYLMALVYKGASLNPAVVSPEQVLGAATRTGALSQGRDDCGVLQQGARADLVVLDTDGPSWTPAKDPLANLVFAGHGSDICLTMVDGRIVYRDGVWPGIDVERAKAETAAATERIISEL